MFQQGGWWPHMMLLRHCQQPWSQLSLLQIWCDNLEVDNKSKMGHHTLLGHRWFKPMCYTAKKTHLSNQVIGKVGSKTASTRCARAMPLCKRNNENHRERETENVFTSLGTPKRIYLPAPTSKWQLCIITCNYTHCSMSLWLKKYLGTKSILSLSHTSTLATKPLNCATFCLVSFYGVMDVVFVSAPQFDLSRWDGACYHWA